MFRRHNPPVESPRAPTNQLPTHRRPPMAMHIRSRRLPPGATGQRTLEWIHSCLLSSLRWSSCHRGVVDDERMRRPWQRPLMRLVVGRGCCHIWRRHEGALGLEQASPLFAERWHRCTEDPTKCSDDTDGDFWNVACFVGSCFVGSALNDYDHDHNHDHRAPGHHSW